MNLPFKAYWDLLSQHVRPQRGRFASADHFVVRQHWLADLRAADHADVYRFRLGWSKRCRPLLSTALAFIGVALLQQVMSVSVTYLGENVAWTATNALRAELAWHALNLDMKFP